MITKQKHIIFYKINTKNSYYTLQNFPVTWQLILFSDGSFTQNINSITGKEVRINLLRQNLLKNNQIIRYVWIEDLNKNKIAFAESSWQNNLKLFNYKPIGQSLINNEIDISKAIKTINYGYNYFIEQTTKRQVPIFNKEYAMYNNKNSLNNIKEFFLPKLKSISSQIT
uniref:hypothetical protein n=1 Tax=Synarthrophyton patena TaxID=48972 RepID=UPI00218242CF|nr:hypothetical protein N4M48_pgp020 [Synarthrophyton patena]UVF63001.1 hypothetical protein [Synarthrophyton patena]